jgi:hypothetical protein
MSDYNPIRDLAPKDLLETGDPDKLILGAELQEEHDAIAVAVATKFDATDIATEPQAVAMDSNEVLITPLRLRAALFGSGGVGLSLIELGGPGEDGLLYWDESSESFVWITFGDSLVLNGGVLDVAPGDIDITELDGFDPNRYLDHTQISVIAGEGLTGGGTIEQDRTINFSIPSMGSLIELDEEEDLLAIYDASAGSHKKTPVLSFRGLPLGDLQGALVSGVALTANTYAVLRPPTTHDALERGVYDPDTGLYTAGEDGARILMMATLRINSLPKGSGGQMRLEIRGPGTTVVDFQQHRNDADSTASTYTLKAAAAIVLTDGQTASAHMWCSGANTAAVGSNLTIIELG